MDDNNYIPLKEKNINEDLPGHDEITEQQFNDTDSAPAIQIQNHSDNKPSQHKYELKIKKKSKYRCRCRSYGPTPNPKRLVLLSIGLIVICIIDIIFEIIYEYHPALIADTTACIIMAVIYISFTIKGISVNHPGIGTPSILLWFVGFGLRLFAMTQLKITTLVIIEIFVAIIRTLCFFICTIQTCKQ